MASKVTFKISLSDLVDDIYLTALTQTTKKEILSSINEFVIDKILMDTSRQTSAVTGQRWKGLDKKSAYYKEKAAKGSATIANLELSGDMLDALKGRVLNSDETEIGIFKRSEALKADGHCHTGIFGESTLPVRQFIPAEGEELRSGIMKDVINLANQLVQDAPKRNNLSKDELTALAMEITGGR